MKTHSLDAEIKNSVLKPNDTPGSFECFLTYGVSLQQYGVIYISTYLGTDATIRITSGLSSIQQLPFPNQGQVGIQPIVHVF